MRVFLIGYMGSGKTTLGQRLASRLELEFIDLDALIEEKQQKPISKIFEEEGEDSFRGYERETLLEILTKENVVVSVGGGTPCFFDNMEIMNQAGKTIFLNVKPGILASRLEEQKQNRPLLKEKNKEEIQDYVEETLKKRLPYYTKARHQITSTNIKIRDIVLFLGT